MSNNDSNFKLEKVEKMELSRAEDHQTIYVDKLSSLAIGPNVSRLGLGLEDPQSAKLIEKYTLIIPTASVLEMIEVLSKTLSNVDLKDNLLLEIEKYKSKF
ncbi:hypothetical protein C9426_01580 [Serratia sp. S1B]|nr:hypothetical protein C9426_01580 [Serratia sp. S1B]